MRDFFILYKGVYSLLRDYWSAYGGWRDLVRSPYLHISLLLGLHSIYFTDQEDPVSFYDLAIVILPNLLGFTLAGFAMLMAFGNQEFLEQLCGVRTGEKEKHSPLIKHGATYMHFLIVQGLVLIFSMLCKVAKTDHIIVCFIGYASLYYSVFLSIATVASVFRMVRYFDKFSYNKLKQKQNEEGRDK